MKTVPSAMIPQGELGPSDPWHVLKKFTPARIALGRAGGSIPTRELLRFQLAHAQARDAVHQQLDVETLLDRLQQAGFEALLLHSMAPDRSRFIARPDLGRTLDEASQDTLTKRAAGEAPYDCVFVIADGLSAAAIERHAVAFLTAINDRLAQEHWRIAPVCVVREGRVAVGDVVGQCIGARMTALLVGERPGLSSPDSLGIYLTWDPRPGRSNAERNCISNIRPPQGLAYATAAQTLHYLMSEARRREISGVALKDEQVLPPSSAEILPSPP